ncbi:Carbohydrate-binding WSC [Akanthomyces lecanii RCEF 1005]|uniref:Carbohydrate-binding WSC n=1 Tax=Akanthomyces lecanii RCEF 1005 TaxID=1081108 RepID=A0A168H3N3_CORDF|nr:Carbohydrate-binding WSC [Akanthomyces lecanii RCEF 1005]
MYLTWLLPLVVLEAAAQSSLCSTTNTADSGSNSDLYQSRGACSDRCRGQSAYAVVQDDKCWCSNTTPGSTTDSGSCNKACPGYPQEMCGGNGLYSYVLLDKSKVKAAPSSLAPPSSQQQQPSSEPPSEPAPPQIVTITQTNAQDATTVIKTVQASASPVDDKSATFRTVTVTGAPTVISNVAASETSPATATPQASGSSGLKKGTIAGIAVGGSAAGVFMGLVAFMIWRRNKYHKDKDAASHDGGGQMEADDEVRFFGAGGATSIRRDNTSASEDSRMGAFGHKKSLVRNSIGSLEDGAEEANQVLRVVNV